MGRCPLIEVEGLTKHYDGVPAIVDLGFTVARGQALGLVGPAGSGKSTALRALAGVVAPTSGSVRVAGHDAWSREARRTVGYLPEGAPLYDEMRVEPFLRTMCQLRGVAPGLRRERVDTALERCGLADQRRAVVGHLSAGQRLRVGLAQAIVHDPQVLVLDEPGEAVDLVAALRGDRAVVLAGRSRSAVSAGCDRVLVLEAGRVVADEAPAELPEAPPGLEVLVVIRGDAGAAERHLQGLGAVSDVAVEDVGDGIHRLTVTGEGDDLQDAVARTIVQHGIGLKELSTRQSTLPPRGGGGPATDRIPGSPGNRGVPPSSLRGGYPGVRIPRGGEGGSLRNRAVCPGDPPPAAGAATSPARGDGPLPDSPARTARDALWDSGLLNVLALARRDLAALFLWPVSYAIAAALIVPVASLGYLMPVLAGDPLTMEGVFRWVAVATAFLVPMVTMRLLAEDRRAGTLELVLAAPVRCWELVVARWLAGLLFLLAATAFTLVYVALLAVSRAGVDVGAIVAGYLGVLLVVAAWVALGLLAASLAPNRVIAAAAGIVALLVLEYAAGAAAGLVPPPLSDLLDYASAGSRALSFDRGQVVVRDVVYFLGLTSGALVVTARVLASRYRP